MSIPSGVMQEWPVGAPVTLHTLATEMISISDNTATDHLVLHLGRQNIEVQQKAMGHHNPSLNAPFLTTYNMFVMKNWNQGVLAKQFLHASENDQRALVESIDTWSQHKEKRPSTVDDFSFSSKPVLVDSIEWFATTPDLCRAMDWIRKNSSDTKGKPMMEILGVNPGLSIDNEAFPVIAYKGGSETGVLNMTFLLQRKDGIWFALSASWMDKEDEVDLEAFSGILTQFINALK